MKLVSAMHQFDYDSNKGSFRGWLKTVTTNAVRDLGRKRSSSELTGAKADEWISRLFDRRFHRDVDAEDRRWLSRRATAGSSVASPVARQTSNLAGL